MKSFITNPILIALMLAILSPFLMVMGVMDYFARRGNAGCHNFLYDKDDIDY